MKIPTESDALNQVRDRLAELVKVSDNAMGLNIASWFPEDRVGRRDVDTVVQVCVRIEKLTGGGAHRKVDHPVVMSRFC